MMKTILIVALTLALNINSSYSQGDRGGRRRPHRQAAGSSGTVYATADDGTPLRWTVYPASGSGPHPAVLVIHGGGFRVEPPSPQAMQASRDAAAAGFNVFRVQYRLAPRGKLPDQKSAGHYPDQTNDLKAAVRAARHYAGGNGLVGAIGGSAGGSHDVYLAATGTPGDDRLDAAVALSGAYDFADPRSLSQGNFRSNMTNYVGSSGTADLQRASPITYVDARVAPLFIIASDREPMPPEQFAGLIGKLTSVGARNFQQLLRPNSAAHAFAYWPDVRERCLAFLKEKLSSPASPPGATPTPAPTSTPTP